jgi:hypothetical protein
MEYKMKTAGLFFLLLFSLSGLSNAQFLKSGVAVTAVTPVGNFSDIVNPGYGGVFMAKLGFIAVDITGSVEYLRFSEKEVQNNDISSTMWSVNAGARIGIFPMISAGAELGNFWITTTIKNDNGETDNSDNKIGFTPLIAVNIGMLEASLRYSIISDAGFFSLRAGIYF